MNNFKEEVVVEDRVVYRERIRSHYVIYYTQFLTIITFGTVLVGLWPYLNKVDPTASKIFLGYLFASHGLTQTLFSPIVGYCSNKLGSNRLLFVIAIVIDIISLLIHALVESFPSHRKYWMLLSRLLAGIASANITICRLHISTTTLIQERRKAVSLLSSTSIVALGLGAGVQYITIPIGDAGFYVIPGVNLNMYSAVAWILIIMAIINLFLFLPSVFKEHSMVGKNGFSSLKKESYNVRKYKWLAWVFISCNFLLTFQSTLERVLGTPMAMDQFAMTREEAVALTAKICIVDAIASIILTLMVNIFCKYISEFRMLLLGLAFYILGRSLLYPMGTGTPQLSDPSRNVTVGCPATQAWCSRDDKILLGQFVAGILTEKLAYSLCILLTIIIFSKILGSKPQGVWMGIFTSSGSLARIIAPVLITRMYANLGPKVVILATNFGFIAASAILMKIADYCILDDKGEEEVNVDLEIRKGLVNNSCQK